MVDNRFPVTDIRKYRLFDIKRNAVELVDVLVLVDQIQHNHNDKRGLLVGYRHKVILLFVHQMAHTHFEALEELLGNGEQTHHTIPARGDRQNQQPPSTHSIAGAKPTVGWQSVAVLDLSY